MNADTATDSPIIPSSMILRHVWRPPPRNVSGAQPILRSLSAATSSILHPSSKLTASGFSVYTCLPASSAASETSAWTTGTVKLRAISTSSSASNSSGGIAGLRHAVGFRLGLGTLGHYVRTGDDLDVVERGPVLQIDTADLAAPDDTDFDRPIFADGRSLRSLSTSASQHAQPFRLRLSAGQLSSAQSLADKAAQPPC